MSVPETGVSKKEYVSIFSGFKVNTMHNMLDEQKYSSFFVMNNNFSLEKLDVNIQLLQTKMTDSRFFVLHCDVTLLRRC